MSKTKIQWTEHVWNPTRGCSKIAPGCKNCYAERMAARQLPAMAYRGEHFAVMTPRGPSWTGRVALIPEMLDIPLRRQKPTTYFVNSMSDLFHEGLTREEIYRVFAVMKRAPHHRFIILTKRGKRMREIMPEVYAAMGGVVLPHVIFGVSASTQPDIDEQVTHLIATPAACRMLSLEPLLEDVDIFKLLTQECCHCGIEYSYHKGETHSFIPLEMAPEFRSIDWVIVGGESGPGARPCHVEHIRDVLRQCKADGVPVFVKQLGALIVGDPSEFLGVQWMDPYGRFSLGAAGHDPEQWPEDLRVRELPEVLR